MGTDIHGIFQRYDEPAKKWVDVPSLYEQDRHYQLFAVLAGVRNGYGFAGDKTGEPVVPISRPRGLPEDFEVDGDHHPLASMEIIPPRMREWYENDSPLEFYTGDHSFSWLAGEEMLAWFNSKTSVKQTGILGREEYEKWDRKSKPTKSCGGISGPNIVLIEDTEDDKDRFPNWTHIVCTWTRELNEELAYFFDEVERLVKEHGKIRFVFGFDN